MIFDSPLAFLLILMIPLFWYLHSKKRKKAAIHFSSTAHARKVERSWKQKVAFLPTALRSIAILLLIVALARPQEGKEEIREISKGVAIYAVLDRSGSMKAEMGHGDQQVSRLDVVKKVFQEFVEGNGHDLPGRPNDLVAMITFARYADTVCPLTLSHGALSEFLKTVNIVTRQNEDGTSIGDALALASARLKTAEEQLANQTKDKGRQYEIKSKVIILLTDGEHNCGKRTPQEAAQLAKQWGIKIYTIGIGGGDSYTTISTPLGEYKVPVASHIDESSMREIAESTGGVFRMVQDGDALKAVYKEIDSLEKSEVESVRYLDYRELFSFFAFGGLLALTLEIFLSSTIFRRIP